MPLFLFEIACLYWIKSKLLLTQVAEAGSDCSTQAAAMDEAQWVTLSLKGPTFPLCTQVWLPVSCTFAAPPSPVSESEARAAWSCTSCSTACSQAHWIGAGEHHWVPWGAQGCQQGQRMVSLLSELDVMVTVHLWIQWVKKHCRKANYCNHLLFELQCGYFISQLGKLRHGELYRNNTILFSSLVINYLFIIMPLGAL